MINIDSDREQLFQSGRCQKNYRFWIPAISQTTYFTNGNINAETLEIKESVFDGDSIEFVGCISSTLQCEVMNISYLAVGQKIVVDLLLDDETENPIKIFTGYIASIENTLAIGKKKIVAYDELYYKCSDKDVASWYNELEFPISIGSLRDSLFGLLEINQKMDTLPCDNIEVEKIYSPKELSALSVIKSICQLNGRMGIINRDGYFEYRLMVDGSGPASTTWPYPSLTVFPSTTKYPNQTSLSPETDETLITYYKEAKFEGYSVNKITQVVVRDSQDDESPVSYGSGTNKYIVQNNMFIRGLSSTDKSTVAQKIYNAVKDFSYLPFKSKILGQPWLEVGDWIRLYVVKIVNGQQQYDIKDFCILNRTFKGCQDIEDEYEARGTKNQKIFVSDIGQNLDLIEAKVDDLKSDVDSIKDEVSDHESRITELEEGGAGDFKIVSTTAVPYSPQNNTLYLIQGELIYING